MGRRIVLLSDGTGNSAAKVWRTNVWRLFESIDLSNDDQIAYYDDGVGTAAFKPVAILGGAFGYGLKRNVIDLYKFACRNYRHADDEIYAFGFSRGAFTIRILIGLILEQGLVQATSETELHTKAKAAYRAFRAKNFHTAYPPALRPERLVRAAGHLLLPSDYNDADNRKDVTIRFVGLWDTVAAYGLPIEEMTLGFSKWIWPWMMPDFKLHPDVRRACQALSIDDERTTFHPVLWDEHDEKPLVPGDDGKRMIGRERISQVWFAGAHSNVGGGYPDDALAQIPLLWIMKQAEDSDLRFKTKAEANPQTIGHADSAQDKDGRQYDPRQGLGGYYRYGPRDLRLLGRDLLARQEKPALPRIHESVLRRVKNRAHSYAPLGLPKDYEIVTVAGEVLAPDRHKIETATQAEARWHVQEKLWNLVWCRRAVYFLTVAVSVYLAAFPLMKSASPVDELTSPVRWISDIIRIVGAFLPGAAQPWIDGYARAPRQFVLVAGILVVMLLISSWLAGRLRSEMGAAWRDSVAGTLADPGKPTDPLYKLRTGETYQRLLKAFKFRIAPAFFAVLFAYLGVTLLSHGLFNIQDTAGLVCRESATKPEGLASGEIVLAGGRTRKLDDLRAEAKRRNPALTENDLKDPLKFVDNLPVFEPRQLCQSMQVTLDRHRTYLIRFENTASFHDDTIPAADGFYSFDRALSWRQSLIMFAALPLRRELIRPWFRVVARFGGTGGEESFLDPDITEPRYRINEKVKATREGELFLFVNDAVIGIPGLYDWFYGNNHGTTKVLIQAM